MEHPPPPLRDTQLAFDMLYTCHVTEVVYHREGESSYKKKIKTLYSLVKKCNERHKNFVDKDLVDIYSPNTNKYDVSSTQ